MPPDPPSNIGGVQPQLRLDVPRRGTERRYVIWGRSADTLETCPLPYFHKLAAMMQACGPRIVPIAQIPTCRHLFGRPGPPGPLALVEGAQIARIQYGEVSGDAEVHFVPGPVPCMGEAFLPPELELRGRDRPPASGEITLIANPEPQICRWVLGA